MAESTHITKISRTARDSLDIVCDKNGLQIATYLEKEEHKRSLKVWQKLRKEMYIVRNYYNQLLPAHYLWFMALQSVFCLKES